MELMISVPRRWRNKNLIVIYDETRDTESVKFQMLVWPADYWAAKAELGHIYNRFINETLVRKVDSGIDHYPLITY